MTDVARTRMRDIGRAAIRAELAQVAFELFRREGLEKVTLNDMAAAGGVSRSTFLRYFGSKEEAILSAVGTQGEQIADALRARPADEDDWTALRHALDILVQHNRRDPARALAITRLIMHTPALGTRRGQEKQTDWRRAIAQALADRAGPTHPPGVASQVRAAAALDCLNIAVNHWTASNGGLDLDDLLDEAFAALSP